MLTPASSIKSVDVAQHIVAICTDCFILSVTLTCAMLAHAMSFSIKMIGSISYTVKHNVQVLE